MLDMETCAVISGLYYDSSKGETDIMPHVYEKRLALNMMIMFCYGTRFNSVTNPMLLQILKDAQTVARYVVSNRFNRTISNLSQLPIRSFQCARLHPPSQVHREE